MILRFTASTYGSLERYRGSRTTRDGAVMGCPVSVVIANLYMEIFEEQAIDSAPYKSRIWKRYVDDFFTILDWDRVDVFLPHLNSQQPSIRFTREIENDSKIAFLEMSVYKETDCRFTASVYKRPTYTDRYLAYDSHHPQSVKLGIVKCLYNRPKRLVTKPSVIAERRNTCHLHSFLTH